MHLQWNVENGIGRLTLNQPPSNTMTMDFFRELKHLIAKITTDSTLKAIIISGSGRHFSSGADISELLQNVDQHIMLENYQSLAQFEQMEIPVISAIRGVCLGSAFELALFSHFRICARDAVVGLPESGFNLMPGIGGVQRIAMLAGNAKAIELTLRGSTFSAPDALAMGLVDTVVPTGNVLSLAEKFAVKLPREFDKDNRAVYLHKYLKPLITSA